ncbi:putative uncharacterized protein DDB_G0279653 [Teleopsis dalmanni]|uniref:putative uncharacterized protein DDB_G0279653 n=1 Tax=Teleopsis dalmanni TaxID=139649 RepID=UPI0018CD6942|nr:putative uncharacterized protein DDB_G0279653 [Teleopsis dalmanni]
MSEITLVTDCISEVHLILKNAKKSSNRGYTTATITEKIKRLDYLHSKVSAIYKTVEIEKINSLIETFVDKYNSAKNYLSKMNNQNNNTPNTNNTNTITPNTTMTNQPLNTEALEKYLPIFTGKVSELNGFIFRLKDSYNKLREADKSYFIEYVVECKLQHNVRIRVSPIGFPQSIKELIDNLRENFVSEDTVPKLLQKLNDTKQGNSNIKDYGDKMSDILSKLNNASLLKRNYDKCSPEGIAIVQCNDDNALLAYKKGLNHLYFQTVQAAQPTSFNKARLFAENMDIPTQQQMLLAYNLTFNRFPNYRHPGNNNSNRRNYHTNGNRYNGNKGNFNNGNISNTHWNGNHRYQNTRNQSNYNANANRANNNRYNNGSASNNRNIPNRRVRITNAQENYEQAEMELENHPLVRN